ncbi:signal peptide peptidase SppA [Planctomicrobium sp. SH668]|uniref:signal peptide peptidase SppA n=1 Tax=Planctomicrobium sp. SH668 TaxID=3448126 RepID=UPI003F5B6216
MLTYRVKSLFSQLLNSVSRASKIAVLAVTAMSSLCVTTAFADDATATATEEKKKSPEKEKVTANVLAVFNLHGGITDKPGNSGSLFPSVTGESLHSLITKLKKASEDDSVAAIVLTLDEPSLDLGEIEELRKALKSVREKKVVYAHADGLSIGQLALVAGSNRISVVPTGNIWIGGLYMEGMYLRGLFDLVGLQPDFLTCGDFKSAAEMYTRKEPSPESAEMKNWLIDGLYESIVTMIANDRNVTPEVVKEWLDTALHSAESAQKIGMIDAVESREELLSYLKKTHGAALKIEKSYGDKKDSDIDLESPLGMLQLWSKILNESTAPKSTKNSIAVVHVDGAISLGKDSGGGLLGESGGAYSETLRIALDKIADEPRIRGVVIRINSPGGSAVASEVILKAISNVQAKKPVVVSMGNVAASGGYYIASRSDRIFADETTITGSIGVVAGKVSTIGLWNRIGVNFSSVQRGKNAGLLRSGAPWTKEEKAIMQQMMDETYEVFKGHVTSGREGKLSKPIDEIAGGRVYTGKQALALGLVDEIGTLSDAIAHVAGKVELKDYELKTFPEQKNFIEQLFADVGNKKKDEKHLSLGLWNALSPSLEGLDPIRVRMVKDALLQLDSLQQERVILTAPIYRLMSE